MSSRRKKPPDGRTAEATPEIALASSRMGSEVIAWQLRLAVIDILISSVNGMTALIRGIMPAIPAEPLQVAPPQVNEEEAEEEEVVQEEPPVEPFMMFPHNHENLIGDAIQQGCKFLAFFINDFMVRIACPPDFSANYGNTMTPTVRIIGESGNQIEVPTHMVDGAIVLSGSWFDVVESEKIVYGDIGLFVHYAPNHLALLLFDPNGLEKPMARRPEFWSPQTAYENHAALYRNPIAQSILVAHPMMHMRFDHSNSMDFTWPILSTMLQLWINNPISYPLYAVRLNHSNVNKYQFYLNSRVSKWFLPEVAVRFYDEDSEMEVEGILKKDDNQMKAFGGVWREMVQLYGYRVGEVLVLAMRDELDGVVSIRVYPVEEQ